MEIKERIQIRSRLLNENIDQMIDDIFKISDLIVDSIKNRRKIIVGLVIIICLAIFYGIRYINSNVKHKEKTT